MGFFSGCPNDICLYRTFSSLKKLNPILKNLYDNDIFTGLCVGSVLLSEIEKSSNTFIHSHKWIGFGVARRARGWGQGKPTHLQVSAYASTYTMTRRER